VVAITEDRVVIEEIAQRAKAATASVRYWVAGERGPGGFPEPKGLRELPKHDRPLVTQLVS
jgi:hypothetical protein